MTDTADAFYNRKMSSTPKTAIAHNAELTGAASFTPHRVDGGIMLPVEGMLARIETLREAWEPVRDDTFLAASTDREMEVFYNAIADILNEPRFEARRRNELLESAKKVI